ncbi:MAG TPA: hypothetical protein VFP36_13100 [Usitatibacter sp.]|nr:hypothetical protein [Usitatibacter sp.]
MRRPARVFLGVLLAAATVALPSSGAFAASDGAASAGRASASIDFTIRVPHVMQMRLLAHPAAIDVTAEDVARGRIRVTGPALDVLVNDRLGYLIRAELAAGAFSAVRISGLSSTVVATQAGALIRMASMVGRPRPDPMPVEYELELAPDAQPGRYAWPVTLTLQQL